jgi:hypothetical protein
LADRRLKELKEQIGILAVGDDSRTDFETVAKRWLESVQHFGTRHHSTTSIPDQKYFPVFQGHARPKYHSLPMRKMGGSPRGGTGNSDVCA